MMLRQAASVLAGLVVHHGGNGMLVLEFSFGVSPLGNVKRQEMVINCGCKDPCPSITGPKPLREILRSEKRLEQNS